MPETAPETGTTMPDDDEQAALDDVQFCSFCSEPFPMDDPMVDYDGQTFCSPDCVREMLNNDDPCDHAAWVAAVGRFNALLGRVLATGPQEGTDGST